MDMKAKIRASVKEVQKLSADAKKEMGSAGGPSYGVAGKRRRSSRRGARVGSAAGGDLSFPPGFVRPAANALENSSGIRSI